MAERTDTERLDWVLDQNRRGAILTYVTTRRDVDELMTEDERTSRFGYVITSAPATPLTPGSHDK